MKRIRPDREILTDLYENQMMTARQIGARYNVAHISVLRWLRYYEIPVRDPFDKLIRRGLKRPNQEDLYRLVHIEHLSYNQIADRFGVDKTIITHWLRMYSIPRPTVWYTRRKGKTIVIPDAKTLTDLYAEHSAADIGRAIGVSDATVLKLLKQYGIARRPGGYNGKRFICSDGHIVRSGYERNVDNWLHAHGIAHEYEPRIPNSPFSADFFAGGFYIEIWGVDSVTYRARKRRKRDLYQSRNLPLIEIGSYAFAAKRKGAWKRKLERLAMPALAFQ